MDGLDRRPFFRLLAVGANALAFVVAVLAFHALPLLHEWQVAGEHLSAGHTGHTGCGHETVTERPALDACGHGHSNHDNATCPICQWILHANPVGVPAPETVAPVLVGGLPVASFAEDLLVVRLDLRVPEARGPPSFATL